MCVSFTVTLLLHSFSISLSSCLPCSRLRLCRSLFVAQVRLNYPLLEYFSYKINDRFYCQKGRIIATLFRGYRHIVTRNVSICIIVHIKLLKIFSFLNG
jgi:hypothetical protein